MGTVHTVKRTSENFSRFFSFTVKASYTHIINFKIYEVFSLRHLYLLKFSITFLQHSFTTMFHIHIGIHASLLDANHIRSYIQQTPRTHQLHPSSSLQVKMTRSYQGREINTGSTASPYYISRVRWHASIPISPKGHQFPKENTTLHIRIMWLTSNKLT